MPLEKYVIAGNGAAGISAAEAIRSLDKKGSIVIISQEPYDVYSKVLLHYYIDSRIEENKLFIRNKDFYNDLDIETSFGKAVESINTTEQAVYLTDNSKIPFDKFLIATGSSPKIPTIKSNVENGIHTMWTLSDARKIRRSIREARDAVIIGGSFVGMQALDSLKKKGLTITVIDLADRIMPNILDKKCSDLLKHYLEKKEVKFYLNNSPTEIRGLGQDRKTLLLKDGKKINANFCIMSVGARPNIDMVKDSPLKTNIGLIVNQHMRTNCHNIYAAGDVAEVVDYVNGGKKVFGLWTAAVEQGRVAGLNMAGRQAVYPGGIDINAISILGIPIITIGKTNVDKQDNDVEIREFFYEKKGIYRKFIIKKNVLVGAILMGYVEDGGRIGSLIRSSVNVDHFKNKFSLGSLRDHINFIV